MHALFTIAACWNDPMNETNTGSDARCGGGCSHCSASLGKTGGPEGWRLVAASVGIFLLPLIAAAICAAALRPYGVDASAAGACIALVVGMIIAICVGKLLRRDREADAGDGVCPRQTCDTAVGD